MKHAVAPSAIATFATVLACCIVACAGDPAPLPVAPAPIVTAQIASPAPGVVNAAVIVTKRVPPAPEPLMAQPGETACLFESGVPAAGVILGPSENEERLAIDIGQSMRISLLATGPSFVEVTAPKFRARGVAFRPLLHAAHAIPFGAILSLMPGAPVEPIRADKSSGRVTVAAPTVGGLRFKARPDAVDVVCTDLTPASVDDAGPPEPKGYVEIGHTPRDLFATPGGPVIATAYDEGTVAVVAKKGAFVQIAWDDGIARVVAWTRAAGLPIKRPNDRAAQLISALGNTAILGVLSSGPTETPALGAVAAQKAQHKVHCDHDVTLSSVKDGRSSPLVTVKDVDLWVGEAAGAVSFVRPAQSLGLTFVQPGSVAASAASLSDCTDAPK